MKTNKNIIIIGARGFGREVYHWVQQSNYRDQIKGFLDDDSKALNGFKDYPPILSSVEDYKIQETDFFVCALGDPNAKKKYIEMILLKGGGFVSIIHPLSKMNMKTLDDYSCGQGLIVGPFAYISNDCKIGNFVTIHAHSAIGHDVEIGDYCTINSFAFMGGFSKLGECSIMNPSSTLKPKTQVGNNSVVGVNSTVLKNVKDNTTVFGLPAKEII